MMFTLIFVLFGVLMWAAAGVLLYFRRRQSSKTGLMRDTETSAAARVAAMAAGTPVEVKGTLRCEEPLTSEMAGRECAYYVSRVIREYRETERDADGDLETRRRSAVVSESERFAPFFVEDPSGMVGVRGEGAEVDALEVANRFEEREDDGPGFKIGGVTVQMGEGQQTLGYRHVEHVLPVDAPVYVLGTARADGRIGAPEDEGGDGRFLISHRSEEDLSKGYKRDALVLALVAAGLFVFGAVFLTVGLGAGLLAAGPVPAALGATLTIA
jgi:E3 Ubiquitin ligase